MWYSAHHQRPLCQRPVGARVRVRERVPYFLVGEGKNGKEEDEAKLKITRKRCNVYVGAMVSHIWRDLTDTFAHPCPHPPCRGSSRRQGASWAGARMENGNHQVCQPCWLMRSSSYAQTQCL